MAAFSPTASPPHRSDQSMILEGAEDFSASKLTSPIRVDDEFSVVNASCNAVMDHIDGDSRVC